MTRSRGFLLAGAAVLAVAGGLFFRGSDRQPLPPAAAPAAPAAPAREIPKPDRPTHPSLPELPAPAAPPQVAGSPTNTTWTAERISELEKLAWFDDAASLQKIMAELYSPLPEIRAAALAATRAFGSRDAVPYLEQAANGTSDPEERKALADAIEYLKLPTLLEEQIGEPEPEE